MNSITSSSIRVASRLSTRNIKPRLFATVTDAYKYADRGNQKASNVSHSALQPAALRLQSGHVLNGVSFGSDNVAAGEAVFTTSLTGYVESMTDPSYRGQILVFTQPLIGNYGVPAPQRDEFGLLKNFESEGGIKCAGIVVSDFARKYSHWTATESLSEWCARYDVPAISGIDTRALTQVLRDQGSTLAQITSGDAAIDAPFSDPNAINMVAQVSTREPYVVNAGGHVRIAVVDCGAKTNILRSLASRGAELTVLPWDHDIESIAHLFDGIFITNGPGSPAHLTSLAGRIQRVINAGYNKPIYGICMGNQIIGMAAGMKTYKLQYGNRGANVGCVDITTGRSVITSQNHGYALDDSHLDVNSEWQTYFVNANDGSNEGIRHKYRDIASVQFHPEAKQGPEDTAFLFDEWVDRMRAVKNAGISIPMAFPNAVRHMEARL